MATWHEAIQQVLAASEGPLSSDEIAERIGREGLRDMRATPVNTVVARISESIKHEGTQSPYRRVSRGRYTLADQKPLN